MHKIFKNQQDIHFLVIERLLSPFQRMEEKEMHLNYSKEASTIKFKIKYPDSERLNMSL